jgi:hypothetical protein
MVCVSIAGSSEGTSARNQETETFMIGRGN